MSSVLKFETAGYTGDDRLTFDPGPTDCGHIKNGVAMMHNHEGYWVLSFEDLEVAYFAALEAQKESVKFNVMYDGDEA